MIPTPHIESDKTEDIAKVVLMPGDPLRAKFIADNYLTDVVMFNHTRNMFGYTGYYKKKRITVMGSGMGMPSIGIYSYELFKFYDVDSIIRIGSAGSYSSDLKLYDVVLVKEAYSESTYAKAAFGYSKKSLKSSTETNRKIKNAAKKLKIELKEAKIHSSDVFYHDSNVFDFKALVEKKGLKAVEMESFALFANAIYLNKKASCLLTISDSLITHEATSALERQNSFTNMIKIALELA